MTAIQAWRWSRKLDAVGVCAIRQIGASGWQLFCPDQPPGYRFAFRGGDVRRILKQQGQYRGQSAPPLNRRHTMTSKNKWTRRGRYLASCPLTGPGVVPPGYTLWRNRARFPAFYTCREGSTWPTRCSLWHFTIREATAKRQRVWD